MTAPEDDLAAAYGALAASLLRRRVRFLQRQRCTNVVESGRASPCGRPAAYALVFHAEPVCEACALAWTADDELTEWSETDWKDALEEPDLYREIDGVRESRPPVLRRDLISKEAIERVVDDGGPPHDASDTMALRLTAQDVRLLTAWFRKGGLT
jgi:hypothetical protein